MQYKQYVTTEGEGGVQVCAELVFGVLERNVSVELTTSSATASGEDTNMTNAILSVYNCMG